MAGKRTPDAQSGHSRWDGEIAAIAVRRHGIVRLDQLLGLGMSPRAVQARAAQKRLFRIHRGVYSIVPLALLRADGRRRAAVDACGPGAVISHQTAGDQLSIRPSSSALIHVTSPTRSGRTHRGVKVHSGATLLPRDVTVVDGIPCTTVARTLLDLAWSGVRQQGLEKAIDRAELLATFDATALDAVLARAGSRRGAALLRAVAGTLRPLLRSNPERDFLTVCRDLGVPEPLANHWMPLGEDWVEVDFMWPDAGLIVEIDGGAVHGTTRARRRDPRRDARLTLAGWTVIRFSDDDVLNDSAYVRRTLLSALSRPAAATR